MVWDPIRATIIFQNERFYKPLIHRPIASFLAGITTQFGGDNCSI